MVRVIAGKARGVKLETNESEKTRPTLDRVKEAMFSMLQFELQSAVVLDLFAGNGSLGIEALSRGCGKVYFNDHKADCCRIIEKNLVKCKGFFESDQSWETSTLGFDEAIKKYQGRNISFDIILLDPPYGMDLIERTLILCEQRGICTEGCIIAAEHSVNDVLKEEYGGFTRDKTKKYGTVAVSIYRYVGGNVK